MILEGVLFFAILFIVGAALITAICRESYHFGGIDAVRSDNSLSYAYFIRMYFLMTTLTTIGFGDMTPASVRAKVLVMCIMFFIVIVILKVLDNWRTTALTTAAAVKDTVKTSVSDVRSSVASSMTQFAH